MVDHKTKNILIDTDIAIDYLRGKTYSQKLVNDIWDQNKACLSILSVYELYAGMQDKEKQETDDFINACKIEPITLEIAKKSGSLWRSYRQKGITLNALDCMIQGTALLNEYKIATRNVEHYPDKKLLLSFKYTKNA